MTTPRVEHVLESSAHTVIGFMHKLYAPSSLGTTYSPAATVHESDKGT